MANEKAKNQRPGNNEAQDHVDQYDQDLVRQNRREAGRDERELGDVSAESSGRDHTNAAGRAGVTEDRGRRAPSGGGNSDTDQSEFPQHARRGQAQSPVQENHFEPPPKKEGHGTPKLDR
jgi:hypothetical protein